MERDSTTPGCPFGKDCFYQHRNADGTPHVLTDGVVASMKVRFQSTIPERLSPNILPSDFILGELISTDYLALP